jgi:diguanylate cyclase (GGDEF)-like protein
MPNLPKSPYLEAEELSGSEVEATRVGGAPPPKAIGQALRGYLTVIVGEHPGRMFDLEAESMVVGRGAECDIRLDSDGVSRKHAWIRRTGGDSYFIEDLKSTNGTWIDGTNVHATQLRSGARIRVGTDVIVRFNLFDEAEADLQQRLYESRTHDTLTGAYNRRTFDQSLANEVSQASRLATPLTLVLLQIDDMKAVNEYYTQAGGDAMLRDLAQRIRTAARTEDMVARTAQDQFGLISRGVSSEEASELAQKLRATVEELEVLFQSGDFSICIQSVTASVSVAGLTEAEAATAETFFKLGASRLQQAKEAGGNRVVST